MSGPSGSAAKIDAGDQLVELHGEDVRDVPGEVAAGERRPAWHGRGQQRARRRRTRSAAPWCASCSTSATRWATDRWNTVAPSSACSRCAARLTGLLSCSVTSSRSCAWNSG